MNRLILGFACAAAATVAGCAPGTLQIEDFHGVEYVVEGTDMGMADRDGTMRLYNSRATLAVREGRLFRGGDDLGTVEPGDRVLLDRRGRVFVNEAERSSRR